MFLGTAPDPGKDFDARTYRIFQFGHELEDSMAGWIRNAGFDLRTMDSNGKQYGFAIAEEKIFSDEVSSVSNYLKGQIHAVPCSKSNFKVTRKEDFEVATKILKEIGRL